MQNSLALIQKLVTVIESLANRNETYITILFTSQKPGDLWQLAKLNECSGVQPYKNRMKNEKRKCGCLYCMTFNWFIVMTMITAWFTWEIYFTRFHEKRRAKWQKNELLNTDMKNRALCACPWYNTFYIISLKGWELKSLKKVSSALCADFLIYRTIKTNAFSVFKYC